MEDPNALYPLLAFTVACILITVVITIVDPKSDVSYDGFKRPKYWGSLLWQLLVLPVCIMLLMDGSPPGSFSELLAWAQRGKSGFSSVPNFYFAALNAAQLKDFITGPMELWRSKKMFAHHVIVSATCFYAESLEQGYGNFVLSSYALEFGSAGFNLCSVFPGSTFCWYLYHSAIAGSHVLAMCGFLGMLWYNELSITVRVVFGVSGIAVMNGRQLVSHDWLTKGFEYHKEHIHDTRGETKHE